MIASIITAYYKGREYMPGYVKDIIGNAIHLWEYDSVESIIVNDSPEDGFNIEELKAIVKPIIGDKGKITDIDDNSISVKVKYRKVRFTVLVNGENQGIHQSRVNGLAVSNGTYVMFLDQDDHIGKDAIKTYLAHAMCKEEVLVSNAALQQKDGYLKWYRSGFHSRRIGDLSCYCKVGIQIISPGHTMVYREAIPEEWTQYICKNNGADDYFLWLLLLAKGVEFNYIDRVLYIHSYTGDNLSGDTTITDTSTYEFCDYLGEIEYFPRNMLRELKRMVKYKANFRESGKLGELGTSILNIDLLLPNMAYKLGSKTPLGFNR